MAAIDEDKILAVCLEYINRTDPTLGTDFQTKFKDVPELEEGSPTLEDLIIFFEKNSKKKIKLENDSSDEDEEPALQKLKTQQFAAKASAANVKSKKSSS